MADLGARRGDLRRWNGRRVLKQSSEEAPTPQNFGKRSLNFRNAHGIHAVERAQRDSIAQRLGPHFLYPILFGQA